MKHDLLEKLSCKPKVSKQIKRSHKRILGQSIDKRLAEVDSRKTFGHWEIDTVLGNKEKIDDVLHTLAERQTRFEINLKVNGKDQASVNQAVHYFQERSGKDFSTLFKTVTSDNGSEFAGLHDALKDSLNVYFSHPMPHLNEARVRTSINLFDGSFPKGSLLVKSLMLSAYVYNNG